MPKRGRQNRRRDQVHSKGHGGHTDRRDRVLAGEERGCENPGQHLGRQGERQCGQNLASRVRGGRIKGTALE